MELGIQLGIIGILLAIIGILLHFDARRKGKIKDKQLRRFLNSYPPRGNYE